MGEGTPGPADIGNLGLSSKRPMEPTIEDIKEARERFTGVLEPSPLLHSGYFGRLLGGEKTAPHWSDSLLNRPIEAGSF